MSSFELKCTDGDISEFGALTESQRNVVRYGCIHGNVKSLATSAVTRMLTEQPADASRPDLYLPLSEYKRVVAAVEGKIRTAVALQGLFKDRAARIAEEIVEKDVKNFPHKRVGYALFRPTVIEEITAEVQKLLVRYGCFRDDKTGERSPMTAKTNWDEYYAFLWKVPLSTRGSANISIGERYRRADKYSSGSAYLRMGSWIYNCALKENYTLPPEDKESLRSGIVLANNSIMFGERILTIDGKEVLIVFKIGEGRTIHGSEIFSYLARLSWPDDRRIEIPLCRKSFYYASENSVEDIFDTVLKDVLMAKARALKTSRSLTDRHIKDVADTTKLLRRLEDLFLNKEGFIRSYLPDDEGKLTRESILKWANISKTIEKLTN